MLRHLVSLLESVVHMATESGPLQDMLPHDDWLALTRLDGALRKLCEKEGW